MTIQDNFRPAPPAEISEPDEFAALRTRVRAMLAEHVTPERLNKFDEA